MKETVQEKSYIDIFILFLVFDVYGHASHAFISSAQVHLRGIMKFKCFMHRHQMSMVLCNGTWTRAKEESEFLNPLAHERRPGRGCDAHPLCDVSQGRLSMSPHPMLIVCQA